MLVEFSFQNYLSFGKEVKFSMVASNMSDRTDCSNVTDLEGTQLRILRAGAIYGANASGKTNLIKAMAFFRKMVTDSFRNENILENSDALRFQFDVGCREEPVSFEMIFIIKYTRYRYGFEIKDKKVVSEWLFKRALDSSRESYCFKRENGGFDINPKTFNVAKNIQKSTRDNALFLTTTAQFNVEMSTIIKDWFSEKLHVIVNPDPDTTYTGKLFMEDDLMRCAVLDFIKLINFGIEDISVRNRPLEESEIPEQLQILLNSFNKTSNKQENPLNVMEISAVHSVYDGGNAVSQTSLPFEMESLGTQKVFSLLGPWIKCLNNGETLVVDEFGASLHTQLAYRLVRLFQSSLNVNAQLIFATHDTNLLRRDLLRRDQIWFVEKDCHGISDLYSLVEYKINQAHIVRNDASYQKDYLAGKYGAIPFFGDMEKFIEDYSDGIQGWEDAVAD